MAYENNNIEDINKITSNLASITTEIKDIENSLYLFENFLYKDDFISIDVIEENICPLCNKPLHIQSLHFVLHKDGTKNEVVGRDYIKSCFCRTCVKRYMPKTEYQRILPNIHRSNIEIGKNYCIPQIGIYTLVVLSNTLKCSVGHETEDIIAKIPSINTNGELTYNNIPASYCCNCSRYTILKEEFNNIKDVLMCKVIDETVESGQSRTSNEIDVEHKKSPLYYYGYNVQTKSNSSKKQRHTILSSIIEANIMNRRDIINHINSLIARGSKIPSWKEATFKWKEDKQFVNDYKSGSLPQVIFDNIILKYSK